MRRPRAGRRPEAPAVVRTRRARGRALARALACAAALAAGPAAAAAQPAATLRARGDTVLSPVERQLAAWATAHAGEATALLQRLVNVNSGTQHVAGVREVGRLLRAEFDALGFTTRWVDGAPFRRAGHLVAERTGRGPRVLLIGHLDTVFEPDAPFQRWERLDDSTARGPGSTDMKGGDVILLYALKALRAAGQLDRMSITVVLTGDEEDPGDPIDAARAALVEAARSAQVAIGFEDGDGDARTVVAARRGFTGWTLTVTGTPAHSSQVFRDEVGAGAIYEGARILDGFRRALGGDPLVTFNPGVVGGGTSVELDSTGTRLRAAGKSNVVAGRFVATGDLRVISPEALERAKRLMRQVVDEHLPRTDATLTFDDGYPPMAPTPGNLALLAEFDAASRALGHGPVTMDNPARAGAADVSFIAALVPQVVDGLGLAGHGGHTIQETADLAWLPRQVARTAVVLHRVTRVRP